MAFLKIKNRAFSTLASGVSDSDTSWTLATGEGAKFPTTGDFHVTCEDEIVKCTSRSTDVLTVVRAQEGTSAAAHASGKAVELRITAAIIEENQGLEWPLNDETEGNHFKDNDNSYPDGWTQTDAAQDTKTNLLFSFWWLKGNSANTTWDYRKQTGINIETSGANYYNSFMFGAILFRDGEFTADVEYYFGIYGETDSAIDLTKYVRVRLRWDQANSLWKVRGESNNGGGATVSSEKTFTFPLNQPVYFRVMVRNNATKQCREYMGLLPLARTQTMLQSVDENTTWGTVYWRIHMTRGAGIEDYLYIGAVDYLANEP